MTAVSLHHALLLSLVYQAHMASNKKPFPSAFQPRGSSGPEQTTGIPHSQAGAHPVQWGQHMNSSAPQAPAASSFASYSVGLPYGAPSYSPAPQTVSWGQPMPTYEPVKSNIISHASINPLSSSYNPVLSNSRFAASSGPSSFQYFASPSPTITSYASVPQPSYNSSVASVQGSSANNAPQNYQSSSSHRVPFSAPVADPIAAPKVATFNLQPIQVPASAPASNSTAHSGPKSSGALPSNFASAPASQPAAAVAKSNQPNIHNTAPKAAAQPSKSRHQESAAPNPNPAPSSPAQPSKARHQEAEEHRGDDHSDALLNNPFAALQISSSSKQHPKRSAAHSAKSNAASAPSPAAAKGKRGPRFQDAQVYDYQPSNTPQASQAPAADASSSNSVLDIDPAADRRSRRGGASIAESSHSPQKQAHAHPQHAHQPHNHHQHAAHPHAHPHHPPQQQELQAAPARVKAAPAKTRGTLPSFGGPAAPTSASPFAKASAKAAASKVAAPLPSSSAAPAPAAPKNGRGTKNTAAAVASSSSDSSAAPASSPASSSFNPDLSSAPTHKTNKKYRRPIARAEVINGVHYEPITLCKWNGCYEVDRITKDEPEVECTICLEEFKEGQSIATLYCNCRLHQRCIDEWFWSKEEKSMKPVCPTHATALEIALEAGIAYIGFRK